MEHVGAVEHRLLPKPYTLRLRASDLAGNQSGPVTVQPTIGNFLTWMSNGSPWTGGGQESICPVGGNNYITISSQIPFNLTETIVIKERLRDYRQASLSDPRGPGIYNNPWYGDNDSAVLSA